MSVFAHKADKSKFNLGNESDLTGIGDGTPFNAIKTLKDMLTWKSLGTVTGSTKLTLPSSFNELWVSVAPIANSATRFTLFIAKVNLDSTEHRYRTGYATNGDQSGLSVMASTSQIYISDFYNNGDTLANAVMHVWYR